MDDDTNGDRPCRGPTWATLIAALCAGLAAVGDPAAATTETSATASDPPSIESRIAAVRQKLAEQARNAAQPAAERVQQLAQWYNFPNFPNFPNWPNWNNFWRNF